ncbi:MAG: citrate lyase holo-[acyl-carrier protein] synthase [Vibrio sp.]
MAIPIDVEVGLSDLMKRRAVRGDQQLAWIKRHTLPVVSFRINMPGPIKMNRSSLKVMNAGLQAVRKMCAENSWKIVGSQKINEKTGPETMICIQAPSATLLKKAMMNIENHHPLGRLMDLDVIDVNGKVISRQGVQLPRRRCFLCEKDAKLCARSRRHDLSELMRFIEEMTSDYECYS